MLCQFPADFNFVPEFPPSSLALLANTCYLGKKNIFIITFFNIKLKIEYTLDWRVKKDHSDDETLGCLRTTHLQVLPPESVGGLSRSSFLDKRIKIT